jgi:hypothetical protein
MYEPSVREKWLDTALALFHILFPSALVKPGLPQSDLPALLFFSHDMFSCTGLLPGTMPLLLAL